MANYKCQQKTISVRILVACEYSGIVRDAFTIKGHDAWSCDILPTESKGNHYQGDVLEYLDKEVKLGTKVNHIMRHAVGLYHGQIGSKDWKRYLSDNMMARDSDFQKAKHIMTIVQNNEKANQVSS